MKRTILASIIGIAAAMAVTSTQAQGTVSLNNYAGSGALITYGAGTGGPAGTGLLNGTPSGVTWTIGLYGAIGSVTVAPDLSGTADPTTLGALSLLSGAAGDTTTINNTYGGGFFAATANAVLPGYTSGTATFVIVAYNGTTYDDSTSRGHSTGFSLTPATGATPAPYISSGFEVGGTPSGFEAFSALPVPEPSVFALSSIGAAALMLIRRKK